jgi:hypothetical protein
MTDKNTQTIPPEQFKGATERSWAMLLLTMIFILLYMMALVGWLKPLTDERMILRLEPLIFAIIGYYFGRLPGQDNENCLKNEINRQTQKTEAALYAKEQSQQISESIEEKLKNAKIVLTFSTAPNTKLINRNADRVGDMVKDEQLRLSVNMALNILNS